VEEAGTVIVDTIEGMFMYFMFRNLAGWRPIIRMALLSMMWICSSSLLVAQDEATAENPAKACSSEHKKDEAKVGKFVFKTYLSSDGACLEVIRLGNTILRSPRDSRCPYSLGQHQDKASKIPAIANGTDLTGSGHPEMVISGYTGGAHCCTEHDIYELEPEFKRLVTIDDMDDEDGHFEDLDHDGHYYHLTTDSTFVYWKADYAESTATRVILQFVNDNKGGAFHLALKKMHEPVPTPEEWKETTKIAREAFGADNPFSGGIGSWFWGNMLSLIYAGHSDLAWKLSDETWPPEKPGKDKFLADFCSQLKTSPYWPDLEPTVQGAPPACANAEPEHTGK
jgi:hypothetical protein